MKDFVLNYTEHVIEHVIFILVFFMMVIGLYLGYLMTYQIYLEFKLLIIDYKIKKIMRRLKDAPNKDI